MRNKTQIELTRVVSVAVMTAFASAGRILFAAVPDFKPSTAIVILSGISFGPLNGLLTGALTALISNFFFGQGVWTLWQMLAWGLIGLLAGLLTKCKFLADLPKIVAFGLLSAFLYGIIMNVFHVLFFVKPLNSAAVAASVFASLVFDLVHAVATALFLSVLAGPWLRKLDRIRRKYISLE